MVALIIIGAILALLVLINLVVVGVDASYEDDEFRLSAKVAWINIPIIPKPPAKEKKPRKEKKPKEEKAPEETKEEAPPDKFPKFNKDEIKKLIRVALDAAKKFRRKIVVYRLKLWFVSSDPDPYYTVMVYNYVNDAVYSLGALADHAFKIKNPDIRTATDFEVGKPFFETSVGVSVRIGQIVWLGIVTGIQALKIYLKHKKRIKLEHKVQAAEKAETVQGA